MTLSELEQMNELELDKIDKSKLVDITSVKINPALSVMERMESYLEQVKNPYCFLCGETPVKIRFDEESKDLSCKLKSYFINIKKS